MPLSFIISGIPELNCLSDRQIYVDYGETLTLQCIVKATPGITALYWEKINKKVQQKVQTGTPGYDGGTPQNPSLIILKCNLENAGQYRCIASNAFGTAESQIIDVSIYGGILIFHRFVDTTKRNKFILCHIFLTSHHIEPTEPAPSGKEFFVTISHLLYVTKLDKDLFYTNVCVFYCIC